MFENIIYKDEVEAREIKELAIRAIVNNPTDLDAQNLCSSLIGAYIAARSLRGLPTNTIKGATEAEKLYTETFDGIYGAEEVGSWPDCLPFDEEMEYPVVVIQDAARAIAQNEAARREAYYRFCREEDKREQGEL